MKSRLLIPALGVLVFVVAACAPSTPQLLNENYLQNPSLITGEPCAPPCWNEITPGETTWNEALTILEDDSEMTNIERQDAEEGDARGLSWQAGDGPFCCQLVSEDGETVSLMTLFIAPDHNLGEVIDRYGEPTYVLGQSVSGDQASLLLLYPDTPLIVYAFVAGEEEGELTPPSQIFAVTYLTEATMQEILTNNNLYFWEGYQSYQDYVDEQYDRTAVPTAESESE